MGDPFFRKIIGPRTFDNPFKPLLEPGMDFQKPGSNHGCQEKNTSLAGKSSKAGEPERLRRKMGGQIFKHRMEPVRIVFLKNRQADVWSRPNPGKNGGDLVPFQKLAQFLDRHIGWSIEKKLNGKRHVSPFNGMKIKKPFSVSRRRA